MTMMKKNLYIQLLLLRFSSLLSFYIYPAPQLYQNHRHAAFVFLFYACKNDAAIVLYV